MTDRIENPCEEREEARPAPLPDCPPGFFRGAFGMCVPNFMPAPDIDLENLQPPAPARLYPEDIFSPNRSAANEDRPVVSVAAIEYQSATRDLTTIDEDTYFEPNAATLATIIPRRVNTQAAWIGQKIYQNEAGEDRIISAVDPFRLALMNFWYFDGQSEKLLFSPISDPRSPDFRGARSAPATMPGFPGDNTPSLVSPVLPPPSMLIPVKFLGGIHPDNAGPGANPNNYWITTNEDILQGIARDNRDLSVRAFEMLPFEFFKNGPLDREVISEHFNIMTAPTHLYDIFMRGAGSAVWTDEISERSRDWWNDNPDVRHTYQGPNLIFGEVFDDYVFDAPAAFFQNEIDNITISPTCTANVEVTANDVGFRPHIDDELKIPSVYHYYLSKNEYGVGQLDPGEDPKPEIAEYYEYGLNVVADYESDTSWEGFTSSPVYKFPHSVCEDLLSEVNEVMQPGLTNYVEISIAGNKPGELAKAIYKQSADIIMMQALSPFAPFEALRETPHWPQGMKFTSKKFAKVLDDQFIAPDEGEIVEQTVNDKVVRNVKEKMLTNVKTLLKMPLEPDLHALLWPRPFSEFPLVFPEAENIQNAVRDEVPNSLLCLELLNTIIDKEGFDRTLADIMHGHKAYSEVIGYRVEKFLVDEFTSKETKIQEFFFMYNDSNEINFLDNQVIPGRRYNYKIQTINLVVGTEYHYDRTNSKFYWSIPQGAAERDYEVPRAGSSAFQLAVFSQRKLSLVYAPYFEKSVSVLDKPPISPQVSFLPYQGIDNMHAMLLQANYGEILQTPVAIFPEDEITIRNTYRTQGIRQGEKILYKSDSLPTEFELIRIDFEPEEYADFSHPSALRVRKPAIGKTAFCKVDIEPNKYYYYTFRVYDAAGMSNPTRVFRVRMVSYQNGIFMELDPYEMYKKPKKFELAFDRMIKISPSMDQRMMNFERAIQEAEEAEGDPSASSLRNLRRELGLKSIIDTKKFQLSSPTNDKVDIGKMPEEDSVWDKNFKIRFKSKTSSKKFDVNVVFKKKKSSHTIEE